MVGGGLLGDDHSAGGYIGETLKEIQGARRWINLGVVRIQPSEFAKIAFIFLMAEFLSRPVEELRQPRVFFKALGYTALPFALVLIEPDLGFGIGVWPFASR